MKTKNFSTEAMKLAAEQLVFNYYAQFGYRNLGNPESEDSKFRWQGFTDAFRTIFGDSGEFWQIFADLRKEVEAVGAENYKWSWM